MEVILLCFLLLWGELSGLVRFFMGIGLNLCCAIVGGIASCRSGMAKFGVYLFLRLNFSDAGLSNVWSKEAE